MIRKLLLVAAAIAMPASAGAVALVATAGPAAAAATINCHDTGVITFAGTSGLTHNGYATTVTTSTTNVGSQTYSAGSTACTGTGPALKITTANTKCSASGETTQVPACTGHPTEYGYGSFKSYQSGGTSSVKADVKTLKSTINGTAYTSTTCSASSCVATHVCSKSSTYGTEAGFELMGNITAPATSPYKGAATTAIVCLGAITGTNLKTQTGATKPGFTYNLLQGETTGSTITIKTATIDKAESSLNIA